MIFEKGLEYRSYVLEVLEFEPHQNIFMHGMNKNCLFGSNDFHSKLLAIQISAE